MSAKTFIIGTLMQETGDDYSTIERKLDKARREGSPVWAEMVALVEASKTNGKAVA